MQDFKDNFWNKRLKFILMIILIIIVISVPYFMDAFVYDNENIIKIGSINVDGKKERIVYLVKDWFLSATMNIGGGIWIKRGIW